MLCELTAEETSAALDEIVEQLLAEACVYGPPVDALALAGALGITVAADERQASRARYVRIGGYRSPRPKATILLRDDPRRERRHWAIAHEIGEHAAHRVFSSLGVDPRETTPNARESVANQLAGRLLLPSQWFNSDGETFGWDLFRLKSRYSTASHELIARRMLECPPAVIISIFDQGQIYFRRGNTGSRVPPPSSEELICQQTAHRKNRVFQENKGPYTIQAWPIHEPTWRREILRTEVGEW